MSEVLLGPLSAEDVDALLDRGKTHFSAEDRRYIHELSGGHPYLVQAAAGALWSAYEDAHPDPRARRRTAGGALYREAARVLGDIWRRWPPAMRHVVVAVAVEHIDALGGSLDPHRGGRVGTPLLDVDAFAAEFDLLREQGFLAPDPITPSRWRVRPLIFLAWCAAEFRKVASSTERWETWLREQEWVATLSAHERPTWLDHVRPGLLQARVDLDLFTAVGATAAPPPRAITTEVRIDRADDTRSRIRVYLSYAPEDDKPRSRLEAHLATMKREGLLETWCPKAIAAGQEQRGKIDENLRAADVILLCVSADYVASDYAYDVEVALAMQRWSLGEAQVVPILVRPAEWETLPYGRLDPLPRDRKPVSTWEDQDEAWLDVAKGIRSIVERLAGRERRSRP
ncbi:toll/interleukin-1 receptor domain-containing protein [Sorangium sp. So ce1389]|uniref:toll/interleukin-1 receptor domain-containing protein n=1 Tax=Sorangium sp. So ce1389 TaxID=3133336 RepID=UPI003F62BA1E